MSEPLWGAHSHFRQAGLDEAMAELLEHVGDAIDLVEVGMENRDRITVSAARYPQMTPPADIPEGQTRLPSISYRAPLIPFAQADERGRLLDAIKAFATTIPYAIADGDPWPYRPPSLTLRRDGVTLQIPTAHGKVAIYSEDRGKMAGSDAPYWLNEAVFYLDGRPSSAIDVLAAGGMTNYVKQALLNDPMMRPPHGEPYQKRPITITLNGIDPPLDAYSRPTAAPETIQ